MRYESDFGLQSEHTCWLQECRCYLTYHRFSECSLKSPLLAEGSLGPKTCHITSGNQNNKVTTQKLSNQHTPTLAARTLSRHCSIHSKGRPASRDNRRPGGSLSTQRLQMLSRGTLTFCLCVAVAKQSVINAKWECLKEVRLNFCQPDLFLMLVCSEGSMD